LNMQGVGVRLRGVEFREDKKRTWTLRTDSTVSDTSASVAWLWVWVQGSGCRVKGVEL